MNKVRPSCLPRDASVLASTRTWVARCAAVVQVFCPSRTNSSPTASARIRAEARSDPASGSDNAMASKFPAQIDATIVRFWSSVPQCR